MLFKISHFGGLLVLHLNLRFNHFWLQQNTQLISCRVVPSVMLTEENDIIQIEKMNNKFGLHL